MKTKGKEKGRRDSVTRERGEKLDACFCASPEGEPYRPRGPLAEVMWGVCAAVSKTFDDHAARGLWD